MQTFSVKEVLNKFETMEKGQRLRVKCKWCPVERVFSKDEPIENLLKFAGLHCHCVKKEKEEKKK